jgi:hypothetical protein
MKEGIVSATNILPEASMLTRQNHFQSSNKAWMPWCQVQQYHAHSNYRKPTYQIYPKCGYWMVYTDWVDGKMVDQQDCREFYHLCIKCSKR